jgi:WD40 repeat protein
MRKVFLEQRFSIFFILTAFLIFAPATGYGVESKGNSNPEIIVPGLTDKVELVAFSKDSRFIATASHCIGGECGNGIVNIWQFSDFKLLRTIKTLAMIDALIFSPDGNNLVTATSCTGIGDNWTEILIWRVSDGLIINRYKDDRYLNKGIVKSLLFTQDGKFLVELAEHEINVREVSSTKIIRNFKLKETKDTRSYFTGNMSLNQSEKVLVVGVKVDNLKKWIRRDGGQSDYENKNLVTVWDFQTGKQIRQFEGHQDVINFACFTLNNEIISSSRDKTTRLWNLQDGKQITTYKDDICFLGEDKSSSYQYLHGVTFDPNHSLLAAMGENKSVNIRDVQNGKVINTIQDVQIKPFSGFRSREEMTQIAFSPDGKFLVGDSPLRILALPKGNQIASLGSTEFESGYESLLAFSSDGKVLSSVSENRVSKFWNISNIKLEGTFGHPTKKIKQIVVDDSTKRGFLILSRKEKGSYKREFKESPVFNKDGNLLVVRDNKNLDTINVISVLNGKLTKSLEHKVEVPTVLSFNNDETILISSTERILFPETNAPEIKLWSMPDGTPLRTFNKELSNCLSSIPVGKHLICYYTDNNIKFWRISDGSLEKTIYKPIPSKHEDGHLYTNRDGNILAVALECELHKIIDLWHLPDGKYLKRVIIADNNDFYNFQNGFGPVYISPDGAFILVSGSGEGDWNWKLQLYRIADGKLIKKFGKLSGNFPKLYPGEPIFTSDGKYFVLDLSVFRFSDGELVKTIPKGEDSEGGNIVLSKDERFIGKWNLVKDTDELWMISKDKTGKELSEKVLSMRCQDDGEYVMYTPDGYYERSPEGTGQIYWTFPNGSFPESFSFEQLESVYRRPDIIKARLAGDLDAGKPAPPATRPPYIEMSDHREIKETAETTHPLKLTASALDEVKTLRIFVNGKSTMDIPIGAKEKDLSLDVPLTPGMNRITAIAYNQQGFSSNSKYLDVLCKRTDAPKPNLYVIGIGVSEYAMLPKEWQLSSAHKDAKSVISAFKSQEGKIFGRVETKLLTNAEASVEAITDALKSLESVKENDLAVVFLAGHGIMSKEEVFYFLSSSGELEKPENGGISWQLLGDALNKVKGRVLVLLDACHSGNISTQVIVPNDELAQKLRSEGKSGIMVFSASKGRQSALEDVDGGFGVFAHAITQSLGPESKQADTNGNGFVEFMELVDHVRKNVDKETEGDQTPWLSRKELFGDFAIASVLK